jgi:hypothetical protein
MRPNSFAGHRDLGHLEHDAAPMGDNLRVDLHHLLAQAGQRPLCHLPRQDQGAQEVGKVVGQRVELQPDGIASE